MSENWKKFKREFYETAGNHFGYADWKERVETDPDTWQNLSALLAVLMRVERNEVLESQTPSLEETWSFHLFYLFYLILLHLIQLTHSFIFQ